MKPPRVAPRPTRCLGSLCPLDQMQTGTVGFFHLLYQMKPATKVADSGKFLLDFLQPLLPLAVLNLSLGFIPFSKTVFLIRLLNLSDLGAETRDLFPKNFQMIHRVRIPHLDMSRVFVEGRQTR